MGLNFVYVAFEVSAGEGAKALEGMRVLGIRGASVTMPLKIEVLEHLDEVDQLAQSVGAVNTIVNDRGALKGYNTDCFGVVAPLKKRVSLRDARVGIVGAGGAARAAAVAVKDEGAFPLIFARNSEKGQILAETCGGEYRTLDALDELASCSVLINATPVGMEAHPGTPIPKTCVQHKPLVFDMIYKPRETELLLAAQTAGCATIGGLEMLMAQALEQFRLFTSEQVAEEVFRACL